jgi:uncharacterized membrane protein
MFAGLMAATTLGWHVAKAGSWLDALVVGFDLGALAFAVSLLPLVRDHGAADMRTHSALNDANRGWVLAITALTALTILAAITSELPAAKHGDWFAIAKLVGTLGLTWVFTNLVFMLHYAHMHYSRAADGKTDLGGFEFPGTEEPVYWDFLYFSFTAGMSFAASDVNVTSQEVRKILVVQCLLSFVFNIGVLAFSINVLAGAAG